VTTYRPGVQYPDAGNLAPGDTARQATAHHLDLGKFGHVGSVSEPRRDQNPGCP